MRSNVLSVGAREILWALYRPIRRGSKQSSKADGQDIPISKNSNNKYVCLLGSRSLQDGRALIVCCNRSSVLEGSSIREREKYSLVCWCFRVEVTDLMRLVRNSVVGGKDVWQRCLPFPRRP